MELYNATGKLKSGDLRVTRPIGAILLDTNEILSALSNEKITVFIERATGNNTFIATNVNLRRALLASVFGQGMVNGKLGVSGLVEIGYGGAIPLGEGEAVKIEITDLKAGKIYALNGLEMPREADGIVQFDEKKMLTDEISRKFEVADYEVMVLEGVNTISEVIATYANGASVKFTQKELKAISFDVDPIIGSFVGVDGDVSILHSLDDILVIPITGMSFLDVSKTNAAPLNITLKNADVANY